VGKNKNQKKIFAVICAILFLIILVLVVWKVADYYKQRNTFDFDLVSPLGEFTDLETVNPDQLNIPAQ